VIISVALARFTGRASLSFRRESARGPTGNSPCPVDQPGLAAPPNQGGGCALALRAPRLRFVPLNQGSDRPLRGTNEKTRQNGGCFRGVPTGIRTPVLTVKGWCPNRARRWGPSTERGKLRSAPPRARIFSTRRDGTVAAAEAEREPRSPRSPAQMDVRTIALSPSGVRLALARMDRNAQYLLITAQSRHTLFIILLYR
jgi:hypothetical protein